MPEDTQSRPGIKRPSREDRVLDVLDLDRKILHLLNKRNAQLYSLASGRKGKPHAEPVLEKRLWANWEESGREHGLDPKLLRQLFTQFNLLAIERGGQRRTGDPYILAPKAEPAQVSVPGPRSLRIPRMLATLAAAANQPLTLAPVILNDPMIELIKGLNQAGAHLSWSEDFVQNVEAEDASGAPLTRLLKFEENLVYAGENAFNFYLMLALALAEAGRCKFTGGASLKLLNIKPLAPTLAALGARLSNMNPHAPGLPVRLECGGRMASRVELTPEISGDFAAALALAAWSYENGLRIVYAAKGDQEHRLREAVNVLRTCGVDARMENGQCIVPPGNPTVPANPELPLDPKLCAYLLALPIFAGGQVRISGSLDHDDPMTDFALGRAEKLGIELTEDDNIIIAKPFKIPTEDVRLGEIPDLLPLAIALGLRAKRHIRVALPDDAEAVRMGTEMLERLGATFRVEDGAFEIEPGTLGWKEPWATPTPFHSLALALVAFMRPGISLDNPGNLIALWPKFWSLYNSLPLGQGTPPKKEPVANATPKRRRIRVQQDVELPADTDD